LILIHREKMTRTVVPAHPGQTIKAPLPRAMVRDASLSIDQFIELL